MYLTGRDGGKTDEQGHNHFNNNAFSGGVLNGFVTKQNSPLGMSVLVEEGVAKVNYSNYAYDVWTDADETVTVDTADPSNPRIDRLVLYVDRAETPQTVNPNNPGIAKLKLVKGTPASSPNRPTTANVNTAVSNNPWIDLADIRVNTAVTQITNANITDRREITKLAKDTVNTQAIADGAVTASKLSTSAITLGYAQITSSFTSNSLVGQADIPGLSVTVTVPTGGRRIKITGWSKNVTGSNSGYFYEFYIAEGSTTLAVISNATRFPGAVMASFVATAGTHTYKLQHGVGASANVTTEATAISPAFILVELI